ncbi:MAG: VIT1/CCC1 transporter family protein, partial [Candidatus Omnitrophica bacterium]|nr:VIT1/CCC1 transporter family protein [Candidatus Omnitrophota bacterium]
VFSYALVSKIVGLNIGLKLMEGGEGRAQDGYMRLKENIPGVSQVIQQEEQHEYALIGMINEDFLKYISAIVLGLNDALVELTASLAGFTFALQNTKIIGTVGLITGIAASASMAASEYLSTKHEDTDKSPLKASLYTGIAYFVAVILLVLPYFFFTSIFLSLFLVLLIAMAIIFIFTFYVSVTKGYGFKKKFGEMAGLSLGTAGFTFLIGVGIRKVFGMNI